MYISLVSVVKELVVSAGDSVQITLPKNEVQLNAYVLQEPLKGKTFPYVWGTTVLIYNAI